MIEGSGAIAEHSLTACIFRKEEKEKTDAAAEIDVNCKELKSIADKILAFKEYFVIYRKL